MSKVREVLRGLRGLETDIQEPDKVIAQSSLVTVSMPNHHGISKKSSPSHPREPTPMER